MIKVGARSSPLSKKQAEEIQNLLASELQFTFVQTSGDIDKKTSLRDLGQSNFFTKELDQMVINGEIDVAIHSAKDLPNPLPQELEIVALTKGVDPRDSLVFREGMSLETLPSDSRIATSSTRREEMVRKVRTDLQFVDIRGTIGERLALLEKGDVDALIIAEAALIRLELTHLNRHIFEEETAENQGRLAIIARKENRTMQALFAPLDARRSYTISSATQFEDLWGLSKRD